MTVRERRGIPDTLPVHVRSVLAAQILDRGRTACHDDSSMAARDAGRIDAHGTITIAAHVIRAFRETPLPVLRYEERAGVGWLEGVGVTRGHRPRITMEGIAASRNGSNEPRGLRCVANGRTDLGHEVVQARVGHECRCPEVIEELGLRHHLRPPIEETLEEPKRPRRKRGRPAMSQQRMAEGVELARSKNNPHGTFERN